MDNDIKRTVGERVKYLRLNKKMTQETLSYVTGVERTFISHIENGEKNITIETLIKIVSGLDISLKHFFSSGKFNE